MKISFDKVRRHKKENKDMNAHSAKKQPARQVRPYMLLIALSTLAILGVLSMYKMGNPIL
jgi:hypothetical protein